MTSDSPSLWPQPSTRRGLLSALATIGGTASARAAERNAAAAFDPVLDQQAARQRLRQRRLPNVLLQDDLGRTVRFYDDVMKDRQVVLNVMYTVCSNICTPATRNLIEARKLLGAQAGDLHFVSMSLTPLTDTPEALRAYKKRHGIDGRWTFLTGKVDQVEQAQRALGFLTDRPEDDLLSHSNVAVVCDERNLRWSHANTLTSGRAIARMIRFELV